MLVVLQLSAKSHIVIMTEEARLPAVVAGNMQRYVASTVSAAPPSRPAHGVQACFVPTSCNPPFSHVTVLFGDRFGHSRRPFDIYRRMSCT